MKNIKLVTMLGLFATAFSSCYASEISEKPTASDSILDRETFTTVEEKRKLFRALGIEYTHEVIVSEELQNHLVTLAQTPQAQNMFRNNKEFQDNLQRLNSLNQTLQDHSIIDKMIIKKISPAVGYGIIAGCLIKKNSTLGLYSGELKRSSDISRMNDYYFSCNSIVPNCPSLDIDAQCKGNELRFINGSKDHPNCAGYHFRVATGEKRIVYRTITDIQEGQQILADYGDFYWKIAYQNAKYQELAPQAKKEVNAKIDESTFGSGFKKGFLNKK